MKKVTLLSIVTTSLMFGAIINPLPSNNKAKENGGSLHGIDAYTDGIGAVVIENKEVAMEEEYKKNLILKDFIFKYGEAAKKSNSSIPDYVISSNTTSQEEKTKAYLLKNETLIADGTVCNDGNVQTINDKYVNNICVGTNVEGQTCNDDNEKTINDIYTNGICSGTDVEGQSCNDGNSATYNDVYKNGICSGILNGTVCDDGIDDTTNDVYTNGICGGTYPNNFMNLTPGTVYSSAGGCGSCYKSITLSQNSGKFYAEYEITAYTGTNHYFGIIFNNGTKNLVYRNGQPLLPVGTRVSILIDTNNLTVDVYANGTDRRSYYTGNVTNISAAVLSGMKIYLSNGTSKQSTSYKVLAPNEYRYKPF